MRPSATVSSIETARDDLQAGEPPQIDPKETQHLNLSIVMLPIEILHLIFDNFADHDIDSDGISRTGRIPRRIATVYAPDERIAVISNLRLVCRLFRDVASHLLCPSVHLDLTQASLDRLAGLSRSLLVASGVRSISMDLTWYPYTANVDHLNMFAGHHDCLLRSLQAVCETALREWGWCNPDSTGVTRQAPKRGLKTIRIPLRPETGTPGGLWGWEDELDSNRKGARDCAFVEIDAADGYHGAVRNLGEACKVLGDARRATVSLMRGGRGVTDRLPSAAVARYEGIIEAAHADYKGRHDAWMALFRGDGADPGSGDGCRIVEPGHMSPFASEVGAAMARMPRARTLLARRAGTESTWAHACFVDQVIRQGASCIDIGRLVSLPVSCWKTLFFGGGSPGRLHVLRPLKLLYDIPVAMHRHGAHLRHMDLDCLPFEACPPVTRRRDHNDAEGQVRRRRWEKIPPWYPSPRSLQPAFSQLRSFSVDLQPPYNNHPAHIDVAGLLFPELRNTRCVTIFVSAALSSPCLQRLRILLPEWWPWTEVPPAGPVPPHEDRLAALARELGGGGGGNDMDDDGVSVIPLPSWPALKHVEFRGLTMDQVSMHAFISRLGARVRSVSMSWIRFTDGGWEDTGRIMAAIRRKRLHARGPAVDGDDDSSFKANFDNWDVPGLPARSNNEMLKLLRRSRMYIEGVDGASNPFGLHHDHAEETS